MRDGGHLLPQYRAAWAQCFVRFIQAYADEGVPIWGVTVQNEPEARQRWDSCLYSAKEERYFVRDFLGPELAKAGLGHAPGTANASVHDPAHRHTRCQNLTRRHDFES